MGRALSAAGDILTAFARAHIVGRSASSHAVGLGLLAREEWERQGVLANVGLQPVSADTSIREREVITCVCEWLARPRSSVQTDGRACGDLGIAPGLTSARRHGRRLDDVVRLGTNHERGRCEECGL